MVEKCAPRQFALVWPVAQATREQQSLLAEAADRVRRAPLHSSCAHFGPGRCGTRPGTMANTLGGVIAFTVAVQFAEYMHAVLVPGVGEPNQLELLPAQRWNWCLTRNRCNPLLPPVVDNGR
jgi:hypothetical protein